MGQFAPGRNSQQRRSIGICCAIRKGHAQADQASGVMPHDMKGAWGQFCKSDVQAVHALGWAVTLLSLAGGRKAKEGQTSDLRGVNVAVTAYVNGEPRTQLELLEGFQKIPFGTGALSCHIAVGISICGTDVGISL